MKLELLASLLNSLLDSLCKKEGMRVLAQEQKTFVDPRLLHIFSYDVRACRKAEVLLRLQARAMYMLDKKRRQKRRHNRRQKKRDKHRMERKRRFAALCLTGSFTSTDACRARNV